MPALQLVGLCGESTHQTSHFIRQTLQLLLEGLSLLRQYVEFLCCDGGRSGCTTGCTALCSFQLRNPSAKLGTGELNSLTFDVSRVSFRSNSLIPFSARLANSVIWGSTSSASWFLYVSAWVSLMSAKSCLTRVSSEHCPIYDQHEAYERVRSSEPETSVANPLHPHEENTEHRISREEKNALIAYCHTSKRTYCAPCHNSPAQRQHTLLCTASIQAHCPAAVAH